MWFFDCYNQMLCTVLARLQVGMSDHSSSLNFCRSKEKKHKQNLKCYKEKKDRQQMEVQWKWTSYNFECIERMGSVKGVGWIYDFGWTRQLGYGLIRELC